MDKTTGAVRGKPTPVTVPAPSVGAFALSGDGKSLIYTLAAKRMELSVAPFDPARLTVTGPAQKVGQGGFVVANFRLSQDGNLIVYDTITDTGEDIWIMNADGTERRRLTSDVYRDRSPAISPDNKEVVFFSDHNQLYEIWSVGTDGSNLRQRTKMDLTGVQDPVWTPDGKRILVNLNRRPPFWVDPRGNAPYSTYQPVAGFVNGDSHYVLDWFAGALAVGDRRPVNGKPEIFVYDAAQGKVEYPGAQGLSPMWARWPAEPNRYFLFVRDEQCLLYDRKTRKETLFFTAPHRLYNVGMDPIHRRFFFSQIVQDADLWLARLGTAQ